MSVAHATVASNWVATIERGEEIRDSQLRGSRVSAVGDKILSYHWWEMARSVRTAAGMPKFWLINGDTYSRSTSGHQGDVRAAIQKSNLPQLIVPYSALDAAGIERDSILPLEVTEDRWVTYTRRAAELPENRDPVYIGTHEATLSNTRRETVTARYEGSVWVWEDVRHVLGDSVFSARVSEHRDRPATSEEIAIFERRAAWNRAVSDAHWPESDSVQFAALVREFQGEPEWPDFEMRSGQLVREHRTRRAKFLSSFDYQEAQPLYFLCELPRSNVQTVDEAYELLKPPAVKAAFDSGLPVARQGDIFAIPTSLTTRELKSRAREVGKRLALLGGTHTASEVIVTNEGTYARGVLYHDPGEWRERDHARRKMGNGRTWHRILKNTVPSFNRNGWIPEGSQSTSAVQRGDVRAWSAGGAVD